MACNSDISLSTLLAYNKTALATDAVVFWVNIDDIEESDPEEGSSRFLRNIILVRHC
jgi:hypothetical protein